jgi:hypothetical protein
MPTSPSAVTMGENGCTPAAVPMLSAIVNSSFGPRAGSSSATANPFLRRAPRPISLRSAWFSSITACTESARMAISPRVLSTSERETRVARTAEARLSSATNGESTVARNVAAVRSRIGSGNTRANTESAIQAISSPESSRPPPRTPRATAPSGREN